MYGFPVRAGRADPWPQTVRDAIGLGVDHITLYRMRYKGTLMEHLQDRVTLSQVNAQEGTARRILEENGFGGLMGKNTYSRIEGNSGCSDYLDKRVSSYIVCACCMLSGLRVHHLPVIFVSLCMCVGSSGRALHWVGFGRPVV